MVGDWLLTVLFAFRRTKWMTGGCARVVVCVYACVFPLVLTRFTVKSYSPRRTIGTAQRIWAARRLACCQNGLPGSVPEDPTDAPRCFAMLLDGLKAPNPGQTDCNLETLN